jgi:hypothetical protein
MISLTMTDLNFVLTRLPRDLLKLMRKEKIFLGGGFIRETIAGNKPNDIDLFGTDANDLKRVSLDFSLSRQAKLHVTDNAITVLCPPRMPIQFITKWCFALPEEVCASFDFTVCQAVIWFQDDKWHSMASNDFYVDLAARRLVYTFPKREEAAGGSMLRVRKFLQRGYSIQAQSLAGVIARLAMAVRWNEVHDEQSVAKVISGLLREVDPLTLIDGVEPIDEHEVIG